MFRRVPAFFMVLLFGCGSASLVAQSPVTATSTATIRIASFNCSLNRDKPGKLLEDLKGGSNKQARKIARILRTVKPHIVLLNEFDFDPNGEAVQVFLNEYVAAESDWASEPPILFPHFFSAPVNTGVPSGRDFDHDGKTNGPGDAVGFGKFPGQYGMVILSQFPVQKESARTFQNLLWKNMPNAVLPPGSGTEPGMWYSDEDLNLLRISSKSHWDVPVSIHGQVIHLLASHPTPPAFDGPEDRNGRRNRDEIRLWAEYLSEEPKPWLVDDLGKSGTLSKDSAFVILGDQNADPNDGGSYEKAIHLLLQHPWINSDVTPSSEGGTAAASTQKGMNDQHTGNPAHDTADFSDRSVGNLRADYALPSKTLNTVAAGIFWPVQGQPGSELIDCSDHRLVWIDVQVANP